MIENLLKNRFIAVIALGTKVIALNCMLISRLVWSRSD